MVDSKVLSFFKNGGVFLFDEESYAGEASYALVEDFMDSDEGRDVFEIEVDTEDGLYLFYDATAISEADAWKKYEKGKYSKSL